MLRRVVAIGVCGVLIAACGWSGGGHGQSSQQAPVSSETPWTVESPTTTPSPDAVEVMLPSLVGQRLHAARNTLAELGLVSRVVRGTPSACFQKDAVLSQSPIPGRTLPPNSSVVLSRNGNAPWACGLGLPPAPPDLQRVARLYLKFARDLQGRRPRGVPADAPIELFVGGHLVKTIDSADQGHRRAWQVCPGGVGYAGRSCPVSAIAPFIDYPGPIALTSQRAQHPCAHPGSLPPRLAVYRTVTLTPDEARDCTSYFAVELVINDVAQIVAVNVVHSEP